MNTVLVIKNRSRYSKMDQVKFVEDNFKKFELIWSAHIT